MKAKYLCPHCQGTISIENNIVLIGKNKVGEKGIVLLHASPGNYTSKFSTDFTIIEGEKIKFICPVCHHSLSNLKNDKLAQFILVDDKGVESTLVFSQIYGEKCTYIIQDKEVKKSFGDDFGKYVSEDWIFLM